MQNNIMQGSPVGGQTIENLLRFDGQWRSYQKRVLDRADNYLKDKRVHIVAAPGSGKTTLGIELIRRLNAPALILSPSINIRNQWIQRISSAFLPEGMDTERILSDNIRKPALITSITYQALHSCMSRNTEEEDYSDFDFYQTIKAAGIRTLCLDEAHHLRSEWWKALEELVKKEKNLTIISLTATPPYDATKAEWDKYIGLCGPIDEEIIVPELVKEKSLCPHQDYVYFNMPTKEEAEAVINFRQDAVEIGEQIFRDEEFAKIVSTHVGVRNPRQYAEQLLEKPAYLSSLIVFLNAKKLPFSRELVKMLGAKGRVPSMNLQWLEILLQGFLYDDVDSFTSDVIYREQMIELLKGHGLIRRNKVGFTVNDEVNKLLSMSKGKIRSIVDIVGAEYQNLGEDLRLLVLTDYIKKEYMPALGDKEKTVNELGVVPIFENIRREYEASSSKKVTDTELRLAALSGSVVLIPETAKVMLESIIEERHVKCNIAECGAKGYYQVTVGGTEETASELVTELFNQGAIRVLIGTKSLLGEGWDSPCINSLILASFVGSFMLSNQMRGRAIRTMKGNPDKVSNIWHLICMEPENLKNANNMLKGPEETEDFLTLKRRFVGFLGVNYEEDIIENGLDRLSFIEPPYTKSGLKSINKKMLAMAADRKALKKRWEDSLVALEQMDVAVEAGADKEYFKPGVFMYNAFAFTMLLTIVCVIYGVYVVYPCIASLVMGESASVIHFIVFIVCLLLLFAVVRFGEKALNMATPFRYMQSIGNGVVRALKATGSIVSEHVAVGHDLGAKAFIYVYLKGGTEREKDVFAQSIYELFGIVENQRYLLKAKTPVPKLCRYYCVPELFGKRKEDAELFRKCIAEYIGPYELIYTRSAEGRRELLEARIHAFSNKNQRCVDKRKLVKSAWK